MAAAKVESVSFETEDIAIPFSLQQDAWASYKRHRPEYPQSTFDMIYEYHRSHGGKFDAVHDVGAGTSSFLPLSPHLSPSLHPPHIRQ